MDYRNITFLELPVGYGKTTKAIEYLVNEAMDKKMLFITFEHREDYIIERIREEIEKVAPEKYKEVGDNIRVFISNKPIDVKTIEWLIKNNTPNGVVFDGLEWFECGEEMPWNIEKKFVEYAQAKKDITFFVTKQAPRTEWDKYGNNRG